jgi:hypothetical protein
VRHPGDTIFSVAGILAALNNQPAIPYIFAPLEAEASVPPTIPTLVGHTLPGNVHHNGCNS